MPSVISITKLAKLATITLAAEFDPTPIEGNASATDDAELDKGTERHIRAELDKGNVWAWCTVTVTAEYDGCSASDSLGACSYASERDFRRGGYFSSMRSAVLVDLQRALTERAERDAGCTGEVTMSGRQAILTWFSGRDRITASSQVGNRVTPWIDTLSEPENHAAAAVAFAELHGWLRHHELVGGATLNGYAFVLVAKVS